MAHSCRNCPSSQFYKWRTKMKRDLFKSPTANVWWSHDSKSSLVPGVCLSPSTSLLLLTSSQSIKATERSWSQTLHPLSYGPCQQQSELETKPVTFYIVSWLLSKLPARSSPHCCRRKGKAACTQSRLHPFWKQNAKSL